MAVPDLLRQRVDETDAIVDCALIDRIGREEAVDIVGTEIGAISGGGTARIWMS